MDDLRRISSETGEHRENPRIPVTSASAPRSSPPMPEVLPEVRFGRTRQAAWSPWKCPESAHLSLCCPFRPRSLHPTESGCSGLAAGGGASAAASIGKRVGAQLELDNERT